MEGISEVEEVKREEVKRERWRGEGRGEVEGRGGEGKVKRERWEGGGKGEGEVGWLAYLNRWYEHGLIQASR